MAMLYTHSIGNPPQNTTVVFKMRDSVPSARYSPICNILRQWKTSLIPIYRVYRLYDNKCRRYIINVVDITIIIIVDKIITRLKKHFINEQKSRDAAAPKKS